MIKINSRPEIQGHVGLAVDLMTLIVTYPNIVSENHNLKRVSFQTP